MGKKLKKAYRDLRHIFEGKDGKLSGKRILGTLLILCGIHIGWHGVVNCTDSLADIVMMVGTFFGAGLAMWGITSWDNRMQEKMNLENPSRNQL